MSLLVCFPYSATLVLYLVITIYHFLLYFACTPSLVAFSCRHKHGQMVSDDNCETYFYSAAEIIRHIRM